MKTGDSDEGRNVRERNWGKERRGRGKRGDILELS
jgi:hypothetical protein